MKPLALALITAIVVGFGASAPAAPSIGVPTIDASAVQQLLDDAIAEAERLAETATVDLPAALAQTLEQNGIDLPAMPANAGEICDALGIPGAGSTAATTLRTLIESFAQGGEIGLAIGLLTTVVFTTCPIWSPHLETAIEQFF